MRGPYPGELRVRVFASWKEEGRDVKRPSSSMSASAPRYGGCNAFSTTGRASQCRVAEVPRHWRSIRGGSSPSSVSSGTSRWMRSFRCWTSGELHKPQRALPFLRSSRHHLQKKSLRAAERKRADVARARRRWVREQGWLDTARLVFIDETAVTTNMVRLNGWNRAESACSGRAHGAVGDGDVYRWPAPDRHRGPDADQRSHEWRSIPGLRRAMLVQTLERRDIVVADNVLPQGRWCGGGDPSCRRDPALPAAVLAGP